MVARLTNQEKIGRALEVLRRGLLPFVDSRLAPEDRANWRARFARATREPDVKDCPEMLNRFWEERFSSPRLGREARGWVNELIETRNRHAHRASAEDVSIDDTFRALDTAERLLVGIGSPEARDVQELRLSLRDESAALVHNDPPQTGTTFRKTIGAASAGSAIESVYAPDLLGGLTIEGSALGLRSVRFGQGENRPGPMVLGAESQLREYADGRRTSFDLPWDIQGTDFQLQVWAALALIPFGETRSYADIARTIDNPRGAQAVGQANSRNPLLIVIPCHRVISADGSVGGWGPGEDKKRLLLELERSQSDRARKRYPHQGIAS